MEFPHQLIKQLKKQEENIFVRLDADDYVSNEFLKIMTLYMETNSDLFGLACDYYLVQNNNKLRTMSCEDLSNFVWHII